MSLKELVGKQAPSVSLTNYDGEPYTFKAGEGNVPAAIFFYPKAGSYGCTKEACQFRDAIAEKDTFKSEKVKIVGISSDSVAKQKAFVEKNNLSYPVLSDEKGEAAKAYHVGKSMMGLSSARVTIIIDSKGVVRDTLDTTINFGAHAKFVAKWLDRLELENNVAGPGASSEENVVPQDQEGAAHAVEHITA